MLQTVRRFLPAILLVVVIVSLAPFMGLVRDFLFERFQARAVRSLVGVLLVLAVAVFLFALTRIRHRRGWRYAGLALAAALLWIESAWLSADVGAGGFAAQVSVAEKIHIVEYGLLALLFYRASKAWGDLSLLLIPLLGVAMAGILDESVQWAVETRTGDVRDVFLNAYAGLFGLVFSLALDPPPSLRWSLGPASRRRVAVLAALAVASLGAFFDAAHLGYEHHDEEIGRFVSWHTLEELRAASADRERRWQTDPPAGLSPWKLEDFYLTEAGWHANHRNERFEAGDAFRAWKANRILEKYYAPFLDLESFRGSGRHRYPPGIRQQLESQVAGRGSAAGSSAGDSSAGDSSPVLRHRIYLWPRGVYYAVLIPVVLLIALSPRLRSR